MYPSSTAGNRRRNIIEAAESTGRRGSTGKTTDSRGAGAIKGIRSTGSTDTRIETTTKERTMRRLNQSATRSRLDTWLSKKSRKPSRRRRELKESKNRQPRAIREKQPVKPRGKTSRQAQIKPGIR